MTRIEAFRHAIASGREWNSGSGCVCVGGLLPTPPLGVWVGVLALAGWCWGAGGGVVWEAGL
jgi:hypothetical protein